MADAGPGGHAVSLSAPHRTDLVFTSGADRCAGWLYLPPEVDRAAAVVLGPTLAGVRSAAVDGFARHFAAAGFAALVFDYRSFGGSGGSPRQVMTVRGQLEDWHNAVEAVRAVPSVDPERVALWGGSITGGHVLRVAAEDPRIAAVVSHVPLVDGLSSTAAVRPFPSQQVRLCLAGLRDAGRALAHRPPSYLAVIGPPGSRAVLSSPDAEPDYRAILPAGWDNRIAARVTLSVLAYRPGRAARHVRCPILLIVGTRDVVTPPRRAERMVRRAPYAELRTYPARHFESFAPPFSDRVLADSTDFLRRHLG